MMPLMSSVLSVIFLFLFGLALQGIAIVQQFQPRHHAFPAPHGLYGNSTRIHAGLADRTRHHGESRDDHIVADHQVTCDAAGTSDHAARADPRAARYAGTTGDCSVRTDLHVVADLNLIVELDPLGDHRVVDGAAIDGR